MSSSKAIHQVLLARLFPIPKIGTPKIDAESLRSFRQAFRRPKSIAAYPSLSRSISSAADVGEPRSNSDPREPSRTPTASKQAKNVGSSTPKLGHIGAHSQSLMFERVDIKKLTKQLRKVDVVDRRLRQVLDGSLKVMTTTPPAYPPKKPRIHEKMIQAYSPTAHEFVNVPNIWLRDNCQCSSCVHEITKQRLLDTFQIPQDLDVDSHERDATGIKVKWSDGHESYYTDDFIAKSASLTENKGIVRQAITNLHLWGVEVSENPPTVPYPQLMSQESKPLLQLLQQIRRYGFCYIDSTPATPEATKFVLERISFIRLTHYGGFYDFTADLASKDTAYTNIALEAHTDNTYFSDPAGLQAFHLLSHTDGEGGASLLVDGFKVANDLYHEDRDVYNILSSVNIHAHASGNEDISIQPYKGFPTLNHDQQTGYLLQVRWNSSDRAAIEMPVEKVEKWYDAARKWNDMLKKPENEYWCQLTPGRVLVFDNWRVLHGRSAFTGKRRIAGGYINRDDWISKFKMLHYGREKVLKHLTVD
ncbi:Trimethyllysine dioxygenase [Zopfia rhizophila CBS 207.26]|uniref:Trimethyllysine dioxygenase n=1 Tax=Zopfia rhizophila CBS 207.26 TaxID=1314779 RepID=A0A6A6DK86_9PEZI|nr:Trimethyllysine dioxygenase [Zopfia rhizophila CBS 207.26]